MKLYYSPASPFARKAIVTAHEAGIADQVELVNIATSPLDANPELLKHNPLGKIPSLALEDGHSLFDSRVICEYFDSLNEGDKLLPASGMERYNVLVTQSIGDGIMDAAVASRYEKALRPEGKQWDGWVDAQVEKIVKALDTLEMWRGARLPEVHIGSISVACALGYLDYRFSDLDWRKERPILTQMLDTFSKRTSMKVSDPAKA